jgi:hypothetical protein
MTISDFSVHNVLRTYSKQFRIGKLVASRKKSSASVSSKGDAVEISSESKKAAFLKAVTSAVAGELEGKMSNDEVGKRVKAEMEPFIDELLEEFSPNDDDIIMIIKDKLMEIL